DETLRALQLHIGELFPRASALELSLRLRDLRFVWPRIDHEQHVALAHHRAFDKADALDEDGHAGSDFDAVHRLEMTGGVVPVGNLALHRGSDRDFWRRRGRCGMM